MNQIPILLATTLMIVMMLAPTNSFATKDGNFKINAHVGDFPTNSQVCAGTDNGDEECERKGSQNVITFVFHNVKEGTGIWACVDDRDCDYGENTSCNCPEDLYPRYTQVSSPIDVEQESKQEATCAIEGNNNKCEINQGSSIGEDLKDFVGGFFN